MADLLFSPWIDALCDIWAISGAGFQIVKSYKLVQNADFPSSINPADLDRSPIALTILASAQPKYAKGHKHVTYYGITEFHVAPNLDKGRMPELSQWYGRILRAAAGSVTLGGIVGNFVTVDRIDGIEGPVALKYGTEDAHWGFLVRWMVETTPDSTALPVNA